MKRGGCARKRSASASMMAALAANWRATASAASAASVCILVVLGAGKRVIVIGSKEKKVSSFGVQFGHEVVGIAAIEGTGELDDAAIGEEGAAFDEQTRAAFGQLHQARLFGVESDRAQALQRTHGMDAARRECFIQ